jgi:hypothetical protein
MFDEDQDLMAVAEPPETTLTAWFDLNSRDPAARELLYADLPQRYVFHKDTKTWQPRGRGGRGGSRAPIGRMYSVSPKDEERYYLRLLLNHKRGAQSFEDLRAVTAPDGGAAVHLESFKEAAIAAGLVGGDDREWARCLEEAAVYQMPRQMRELFVTLLTHCSPIQPGELWSAFKQHLAGKWWEVMVADQSLKICLPPCQMITSSVHVSLLLTLAWSSLRRWRMAL